MSEMVERVADAIEHALFGEPAADLSEVAKAAIEAMREPTDDMLKSGYETMFDDKYNGTQAPMMDATWKSMIDAALGK